MIEFFLLIGGLIGVTWIIGQVLKAIIKAPSTIAYHESGQAEKDKKLAAEAEAKRAERKALFEKEEKERAQQLQKEFASEVKVFEASLHDRGITENTLVVVRRGNSIRVDVARFKELRSFANYHHSSPVSGIFKLSHSDPLRPGYLSKLMRYTVYGPVVSVNVAANESFVRHDDITFFDVPEHSIVKASPEFECIYDEKVYKPLREIAEAEQAEKLKLENAKNKLDSMFK